MTISKAIELLNALLPTLASSRDLDTPDALKLGIIALKTIQHARVNPCWTPIPTLPGETPEDTGDISFRHNGHAHHSHKSVR